MFVGALATFHLFSNQICFDLCLVVGDAFSFFSSAFNGGFQIFGKGFNFGFQFCKASLAIGNDFLPFYPLLLQCLPGILNLLVEIPPDDVVMLARLTVLVCAQFE